MHTLLSSHTYGFHEALMCRCEQAPLWKKQLHENHSHMNLLSFLYIQVFFTWLSSDEEENQVLGGRGLAPSTRLAKMCKHHYSSQCQFIHEA